MTVRKKGYDREASRRALARVDEITNIYLDEAMAHANREPSCDGFCMALLVSETLARSSTDAQIKTRLQDIREGRPFEWHLGDPPHIPGWRGYQGAIEPLLSKGQTTDGRFTLKEGVFKPVMQESIFRDLKIWSSPGSYVEVGSVLPVELEHESSGPQTYIIGSDKFGHFLSTGMEYLETYLDIRDASMREGLTEEQARERGLFAALVRGLTTEITVLGGWTSKVFAYGDLNANFRGFLFFQQIVEGTSPFIEKDPQSGHFRRGTKQFSWSQFIEPTWDEGINCSHYYQDVWGAPSFQRLIVKNTLQLQKEVGQDFTCPLRAADCIARADYYRQAFGRRVTEALISPQCLDLAEARRAKLVLAPKDEGQSEAYYDALGFYSGDYISQRSRQWCTSWRDALVAERCAKATGYSSLESCMAKIPRISSEKFRCQFDATDVIGWSL
jgi:hypothetical protein